MRASEETIASTLTEAFAAKACIDALNRATNYCHRHSVGQTISQLELAKQRAEDCGQIVVRDRIHAMIAALEINSGYLPNRDVWQNFLRSTKGVMERAPITGVQDAH